MRDSRSLGPVNDFVYVSISKDYEVCPFTALMFHTIRDKNSSMTMFLYGAATTSPIIVPPNVSRQYTFSPLFIFLVECLSWTLIFTFQLEPLVQAWF